MLTGRPEEPRLLDALLEKTSRTFALSIPRLPEPTRREVTVAYLLFRIADTLEDATLWDGSRRRDELARFAVETISTTVVGAEVDPALANRRGQADRAVGVKAPQLSAAIEELERDRREAQEDRANLTSDLSDLEAEKDSLLSDLQQAKAQVEDARSGASSLESELAAAKRDLENTQDQADRAQTKLSSDLDALRAEKDSLLSDLQDAKAQAAGIRELLDQITSGEREAEFERRARTMAETPLDDQGRSAGLPPDLALLADWVVREPAAARDQRDELALLIGQGEVLQGARWRISLSIEDSVVSREDDLELNPFEVIDAAISSADGNLSELVAGSWRAPS